MPDGLAKAFVLGIGLACLSGEPGLTRLKFKQFFVRTAGLPDIVEVAEETSIFQIERARKPHI
jgi:hypothetical protein